MFRVFRKYGITKAEMLIISFLVFSFVFGLILKLTNTKKMIVYKSSETDSLFNNQINEAYDSLYKNNLSSEKTEKLNQLHHFSDSLIKAGETETKSQILGELGGNKLNLNTSHISELMILPGIGQVTAERIVEYREKHNGFKSIVELKNVEGIGEKKFNRIKDFISVE